MLLLSDYVLAFICSAAVCNINAVYVQRKGRCKAPVTVALNDINCLSIICNKQHNFHLQ